MYKRFIVISLSITTCVTPWFFSGELCSYLLFCQSFQINVSLVDFNALLNHYIDSLNSAFMWPNFCFLLVNLDFICIIFPTFLNWINTLLILSSFLEYLYKATYLPLHSFCYLLILTLNFFVIIFLLSFILKHFKVSIVTFLCQQLF